MYQPNWIYGQTRTSTIRYFKQLHQLSHGVFDDFCDFCLDFRIHITSMMLFSPYILTYHNFPLTVNCSYTQTIGHWLNEHAALYTSISPSECKKCEFFHWIYFFNNLSNKFDHWIYDQLGDCSIYNNQVNRKYSNQYQAESKYIMWQKKIRGAREFPNIGSRRPSTECPFVLHVFFFTVDIGKFLMDNLSKCHHYFVHCRPSGLEHNEFES